MDDKKLEQVVEYMSDNFLKESKSEHKTSISTQAGTDAHFEKHLTLLKTASFK